MKTAGLMKNPVQEYAWGSETAIPALLGEAPRAGRPVAELWMGAHPKAPSSLLTPDGRQRSLIDVIAEDPTGVLGKRVVEKFDGRLPFLFKILAIEHPLSIQAHPDKTTASAGFAAENLLGVPLDAANRNYRDANHKPECICALTDFWGLCGFRKAEEIFPRLEDVARRAPGVNEELGPLKHGPHPLKDLFEWLMNLAAPVRRDLIDAAVAYAGDRGSSDPACRWILRLHGEYPEDIGVVSPLLLNLVRLAPGQAMFLPAGELHAYLEGVGVELMANSDNVLRGGLTRKHVDVQELGKVLRFGEKVPAVLKTEEIRPGETAYLTPAEEFRLSVIDIQPPDEYRSADDRSVEVAICTGGEAEYAEANGRRRISLVRGKVLLIPAGVPSYRLRGRATLFKASVPK